jgi:hypothetical protein
MKLVIEINVDKAKKEIPGLLENMADEFRLNGTLRESELSNDKLEYCGSIRVEE